MRWRRVEAWFAALLRADDARTALIASAAFCLAGVLFLTGLKAAQDVFIDAAEAYAWGQQFLGGYGRHPPMTGWIAGLWYSIFPAADWSSYALSRLMTFVTFVGVYFIARRVVGARAALFVILTMTLYPLFHTKGERFNNYQVLLALLPLLVLAFLTAYEKRTALAGALLGLAAVACTLTIYSGLIGVAAIGVAALAHPARWTFLRSPAPYVAVPLYLVALIPHVLWLIKWDFPTIQWATSLAEQPGTPWHTLEYLAHHLALIGIPIAVGAALLMPWRRKLDAWAVQHPDRFLVLVISTVLVLTPPLAALAFGSYLRLDWGNSLFFLLPLSALSVVALIVTRRALARAAITATAFTALLLAAAPVYPWVNFALRPDYGAHDPHSELAREVTALWHARFSAPLRIVVGGYEIAAYVVFYSADHPKMYADFDPALSAWIDYPADLHRYGWIGLCSVFDQVCIDRLDAINPRAEHARLTAQRRIGTTAGAPVEYAVRISPPGS